MAGRTAHDARQRFLAPLQRALSCVTRAQLVYGHDNTPEMTQALAVSEEPVRLARRAGAPLALSLAQHFAVLHPDEPQGTWKVRTLAYRYQLDGEDGRELLSWHWHPPPLSASPEPRPHLHVPRGGLPARHHVPTGRISVEGVLRFVVAELGVRPLRADWSAVLDQAEASFREQRTWA